MKLNFTYSKEKDVWCLLNKGKSSHNSSAPTVVYQELVAEFGPNPDEASTAAFIEEYLKKNNLNPYTLASDYQKAFEAISTDFHAIAERVFGVTLNKEITVYLTVNNRCPYSTQENWFFVSMSKENQVLTMMHELWHFYTWQKFGTSEQERLGQVRYNDLKEALTVLINIECKELLPDGVQDRGYPQHNELRTKILRLWEENPDIEFVWKAA